MDLRPNERLLTQNTVPVIAWLFSLLSPFKLIRMATNKLYVSNIQVLGKTGLFGTSEFSMSLERIANIKVHQGIFGKIFNYGWIEIIDNSGEGVRWLTAQPTQFRKSVTEAQEISKKEQFQEMAKSMKSA
jgi:uncharacterized membrane protein YdbT with pleckstrin-like domain